MSVNNHIRCSDCKEFLWIGQREHIYMGSEYIERLKDFLFKHLKHHLIFDREYWKDEEGYFDDNNYGGWVDFEKIDQCVSS